MTVRRIFVELSIGQQDGRIVVALIAIFLASSQPVDVRSLFAVAVSVLAQIAEHVIEGAVLHHQHDNMVDVGQQPWLHWWLWVLGEWFELARRYDVIDGQ